MSAGLSSRRIRNSPRNVQTHASARICWKAAPTAGGGNITKVRNASTMGRHIKSPCRMCRWGESKILPKEHFAQVVELDAISPSGQDANHLQCLAISNWAIGMPDKALSLADESRELLKNSFEYSVWRYLGVTKAAFLADLGSFVKMIGLGKVEPAILFETH